MKAKRRTTAAVVFCFLILLTLVDIGSPPSLAAPPIQVKSADPPAAEQGTVNLNIQIRGRNFPQNPVVEFFVTGTEDLGGITVNSTTFVSSTELIANITVTDAATISKFDIQVQSNGRIGKGIELFSVLQKGSGGLTCQTSSFPSQFTFVAKLNTQTPALSGELGRAVAVAPVDFESDGIDVIIAAVTTRVRFEFAVFNLDPATGKPVSTEVVPIPGPHPSDLVTFFPDVAVGDLNGDGLPDVVVASFSEDKAWVFFGQQQGSQVLYAPASTGLTAVPVNPPAGEEPCQFAGPSVGDIVQDMTGEEANELILSDRCANVGSAKTAGKVFLFRFNGSGFDFLGTVTAPDPKRNDLFGASVAIGDVLGTMEPDLLVGARGVDDEKDKRLKDIGAVFVFQGPLSCKDFVCSADTHVKLTRQVKGEQLGRRVVAADIDGKTYDDVITVPTNQPPAGVFLAPFSFDRMDDDITLTADVASEKGYGLGLGVGDVNADGIPDILVGNPNTSYPNSSDTCGNLGAVHVYLSPFDLGDPPRDSDFVLQVPPPDAEEAAAQSANPDLPGPLFGQGIAVIPGGFILVTAPSLHLDGDGSADGQVYVLRMK